MNLDALGNIGDLVGGIAVVVTLIYLAAQIRQNTTQVRLNTASSQYDGILYAFDPIFEGSNAEILRRGMSGDELSEQEQFVWGMLMLRILGQFEMSLYQHSRGALEDSHFEMHSRLLGAIIDAPGSRSWWQELGGETFSADFEAHVDRLIANPSAYARRIRDRRAQQADSEPPAA